MVLKIFILLGCIAVARAGFRSLAQPALQKTEESDPHPQYSFGYEIQDEVSGDSKNQYETRDGDSVRGQYSLIDADGFRRIVDYTADPEKGFNAVVRKEPIGGAAKEVASSPAVVRQTPAPAPVKYSAQPQAPVGRSYVKTSFSSPVSSFNY